jgi:hypothetical protein
MPGTLVRWGPFAEMAELRGRFDRLLDNVAPIRERVWTPAVDVVRDDGIGCRDRRRDNGREERDLHAAGSWRSAQIHRWDAPLIAAGIIGHPVWSASRPAP